MQRQGGWIVIGRARDLTCEPGREDKKARFRRRTGAVSREPQEKRGEGRRAREEGEAALRILNREIK